MSTLIKGEETTQMKDKFNFEGRNVASMGDVFQLSVTLINHGAGAGAGAGVESSGRSSKATTYLAY